MRRDIKPVVDGHLVDCAVILIKLPERLGHFRPVKNLLLKLLLAERFMGLEVFGRAVQHVDLPGLAYMVNGRLFDAALGEVGHVVKIGEILPE